MSIRNKRLLKEQHRLDKYELYWPPDWIHHEIITLKTVQKDIYITLKIGMQYPFTFPKIYVHPTPHESVYYIDWFMNIRAKYKDLINHFALSVECVCCVNITCNWAPSYGIANIMDDFIQKQDFYNKFDKFRIIYKKINGFDDLIYKNIISYLIYNGEDTKK